MFEQTFVEGQNATRKASSVFMSFLIQVGLVVVLIIIPLIYTEALPKTTLTMMLQAPPPPPPPPPPPAATPPPKVVKVTPRQFDAGRLTAPKQIPKEIAMIEEADLPPAAVGVVGGVPGGIPGGAAGGVIGGIVGAIPSPVAPPPPKEAPKPVTPKQIRVGGNVQAAKLVKQPKPSYPPLAKQARIQGVVRFNAIIGRDGAIANLQLVSGHPLLVPSATDAVRQWVYQPTLLNDQPVEVVTQIDVNFTLSQ
jgi:protein TonB